MLSKYMFFFIKTAFALCACVTISMTATTALAYATETESITEKIPSHTEAQTPTQSMQAQPNVAQPDVVQPEETIGELWTGSLYSSTYKAGVCIDPNGKVRGVLHLRLKGGQVDTYHFYGQQNAEGHIKAKHRSGHRFEGYFKSDSLIVGKVRTKGGFTVNLEGKRTQDVQLSTKCGPLS